jgi:hypothetical protein
MAACKVKFKYVDTVFKKTKNYAISRVAVPLLKFLFLRSENRI